VKTLLQLPPGSYPPVREDLMPGDKVKVTVFGKEIPLEVKRVTRGHLNVIVSYELGWEEAPE
jgi:hypothetical protein